MDQPRAPAPDARAPAPDARAPAPGARAPATHARAAAAWPVVLALAIPACGGAEGAASPPALTISPGYVRVPVGSDTRLYAVSASAAPGRPEAIRWSSADTARAHVDQSGLVTVLDTGEVVIRAALAGQQAEATVLGTAATLVGAGDVASCASTGDEATAALLDAIPGTVFTAGDNAYDTGTLTEFTACYGPSWGRHLERTRPSPGNHDYGTSGASGYFAWFGSRAPAEFYAYDLGGWRIYSLNSNIAAGPTSFQVGWLRSDLARHPRRCTLAYWHHPRFSSSSVHGSSALMADALAVLDSAAADVVIAGHDHTYERFAPLSPAGAVVADGIRHFVVGTGGRSLYAFGVPLAGSVFRYNAGYGVLELSLVPRGYSWRFRAVDGSTPDSGSASCR